VNFVLACFYCTEAFKKDQSYEHTDSHSRLILLQINHPHLPSPTTFAASAGARTTVSSPALAADLSEGEKERGQWAGVSDVQLRAFESDGVGESRRKAAGRYNHSAAFCQEAAF